MDRGGSATLSARAGNLPTPATAALLDARILGAFEVTVDGRRVAPEDWVRRSAERLVKLLLVTRGHTLARETAAELLWPEAAPDASRVNLRKAIHFAHRALGSDGLLVSVPGRVGLDAAHISLDLDRVEAAFDLLSSRRSHHPEAAEDSHELARALEVVLELGGFDLLPDDLYEDWLTGPREHLRYRWQQAALDAARTARDAGDPERALELLDRVLETDAADEAAHRLVIEILAAQGRHHAVRRQFDLCRRALQATLDAAPSPETEAAFAAAQGQAPAHRGTVSPLPRLVARDAELRVVERLIARVADGEAAALAIHGPTGIGKSRLLRELAGFGRSAGWRVLEWQAVEATETPAYAPLHVVHAGVATADEALAWGEPARSGLASACPGLGIKPAIAFSERAALVDALVLALERIARTAPLVIAIDDLPWLDDATVELLQHVLARVPHEPILIAVTYRDDEPMPAAALLLLEQVRRAEGVELAVGPLGLGDVERLVTANLGGTSVHPDLARWAFGLSEGNPLFCLELVRAARERGTVSVLGDRWTMADDPSETQAPAVSDTIRRLVARRMARLTGAPLDLLVTAAELESAFAFGTLQAVLPDLPGGLVGALDEALGSGLLIERGDGYAFAHPLYRIAVRGAAGVARRAATRLAIARALTGCDRHASPPELLRAAEASPDVAWAANHALGAVELGLPEALALAVALGFTAADSAARLFDPGAASLLERTLAAWGRLPPADAAAFAASRAYCSVATLRMRSGDDAGADAAFRAAIATARSPEEVANAYSEYWWLPYRRGDFDAALALLEEALTRLPADAAVPRATVECQVGWTLGRQHHLEQAIGHLEHAVAVLAAADDRHAEMRARDQLGMMLHMVRRGDEAISTLEQSVRLALDLGDLRGEAARLHLGTALVRSGLAARARPHLERGMQLAHMMGDRYLEAVGAWAAAEMEDALGGYDAAREMRLLELRLLASIGGNPHNEALAHAHLSHLARLSADSATADAEAAAARDLAGRSLDPGYLARIEEALGTARWSDLETG